MEAIMKLTHDDHVHLRPHCAIGRKKAAHSLDGYARAARAGNLILGIREHAPLPDPYRIGPDKDYYTAMSESEVGPFLDLFRDSEIAAGFEVDLLQGYERAQKEILDELLSGAAAIGIAVSGMNVGLHFLPGSVKEIPDDKGNCPDVMWDMSEEIFVAHLEDRGLETLLLDYFECLHKAIDWGEGQVLSHIELIRKFDRTDPSGKSIYFGDVEDHYSGECRRVIEHAADRGMALEINTAGCDCLLGRPYISQALLDYCAKVRAPVVVGSDAHTPEQIGRHFDLAEQMVERAGIDKVYTVREFELVPASM
jgi:HisJ family histidinol phosphate phosphatase